MSGFKRSFGISVLLHALAVLAVISVIEYHPKAVHLPPAPSAFDRAIPISLVPQPHPQPKPPVPKPKVPQPIKPPPAAIQTQTSQVAPTVPPPPANPSPPQAPPEQPETTRPPDYQEIAEGILEANKRYPREALIQGIEGEVELQYVVNNQGTVLGYTIVSSSHQQVLDDEVIRLIRSVRFPPFPAGDTDLRKTLDVTIEFSLHQ
ncbi:MAG: energy transducer TonB [Bacillota bacterium]